MHEAQTYYGRLNFESSTYLSRIQSDLVELGKLASAKHTSSGKRCSNVDLLRA